MFKKVKINKKFKYTCVVAFDMIKQAESILKDELADNSIFDRDRAVKLDITLREDDDTVIILSTIWLKIGSINNSVETSEFFNWFNKEPIIEIQNKLNIFIKRMIKIKKANI